MKTVLAAIDFSEVSNGVLANALSLAKAYGAGVRIVHVATPNPDFVGYEAGPQSERDFRAGTLSEEHRKLNELVDSCRAEGVDASARLISGSTIEAIAKEAAECEADILVVGRHGRSAISRLATGSVTNAAIRTMPIPVLVVPASA